MKYLITLLCLCLLTSSMTLKRRSNLLKLQISQLNILVFNDHKYLALHKPLTYSKQIFLHINLDDFTIPFKLEWECTYALQWLSLVKTDNNCKAEIKPIYCSIDFCMDEENKVKYEFTVTQVDTSQSKIKENLPEILTKKLDETRNQHIKSKMLKTDSLSNLFKSASEIKSFIEGYPTYTEISDQCIHLINTISLSGLIERDIDPKVLRHLFSSDEYKLSLDTLNENLHKDRRNILDLVQLMKKKVERNDDISPQIQMLMEIPSKHIKQFLQYNDFNPDKQLDSFCRGYMKDVYPLEVLQDLFFLVIPMQKFVEGEFNEEEINLTTEELDELINNLKKLTVRKFKGIIKHEEILIPVILYKTDDYYFKAQNFAKKNELQEGLDELNSLLAK
jgi:hypothetical protein